MVTSASTPTTPTTLEETPVDVPQPIQAEPAPEENPVELLGVHSAALSTALEGLSSSRQARQTAASKVTRLQEQLTAAQTSVSETQADVDTSIDTVVEVIDGLTVWLGAVKAELQSAKGGVG